MTPATPVPTALKTCKECRYVGTHKRKRIMEETGFDDQLMFDDADKDETVYTCKAPYAPGQMMGGLVAAVAGVTPGCSEHSGKEIGLVPITCSAWAAPAGPDRSRLSELDKRIAEREARAAAKPSRGEEDE